MTIGTDEVDRIVAVVVLNWNGGDDILNCLTSVSDSTHKAIQIVVVDNGSTDGSSDEIRKRFTQVHFIDNSENLGFAKGSNQGMEWALDRGIEYTLLLNGDARLHPTAIHELMIAASQANDSVVACPKMYLGSSDPLAEKLWFTYGTVKIWAGLFQNPAFNQVDSPAWSLPCDMEYASGCCMLIPARILREVGMFDESFFAYCEDIDLSLRIRKAGFRLRYVPSAHLWHGSQRPTNRARSASYRYLSTRNNLWVVRKHGSWLEVLACLCILPLRSFYRIVRMLTSGKLDSIAAELKGILDGTLSHLKEPRTVS